MKIGVTGASGQLGRLVVQQLLGKCPATDVVAIVRDPAKAADLAAAGVEIRVADYDDRASLDAAAAGWTGCCSSRRARSAGVSRSTPTSSTPPRPPASSMWSTRARPKPRPRAHSRARAQGH